MSVDEAAISSAIQPIISRAFARIPKLPTEISLDGEGNRAGALKPLPDSLADLGNPEACRKCQVPILRGSCSPVCLACGASILDILSVGSNGQQNVDQSASVQGYQQVAWKGSISQRSFLSTLEFKPQDDKRRRSSSRGYDPSIAEIIASFSQFTASRISSHRSSGSTSAAAPATSASIDAIPDEFFSAREVTATSSVSAGTHATPTVDGNQRKSTAEILQSADAVRGSSEGSGIQGRVGSAGSPGGGGFWGNSMSSGGKDSHSPATAASNAATVATGSAVGGAAAAGSTPVLHQGGEGAAHRTSRSSRQFSDFFSQLSALTSSSPSSAAANASSAQLASSTSAPAVPSDLSLGESAGHGKPSKEASLKALVAQLPDVSFLLSEHLVVPDRDPGGLSLTLPDADRWLRSRKGVDPTTDSAGQGVGTQGGKQGAQGTHAAQTAAQQGAGESEGEAAMRQGLEKGTDLRATGWAGSSVVQHGETAWGADTGNAPGQAKAAEGHASEGAVVRSVQGGGWGGEGSDPALVVNGAQSGAMVAPPGAGATAAGSGAALTAMPQATVAAAAATGGSVVEEDDDEWGDFAS